MEKNTLAEKDQKAIEALQHLGFLRRDACTLIYLFGTEGVTSKDIERNTKLRQPEVSQGTSNLKKRRWIKTSKIRKKGKGRPYHKYYLAKSKEKILDDIRRESQKKVEEEQQSFATLREMLLWEQKTL